MKYIKEAGIFIGGALLTFVGVSFIPQVPINVGAPVVDGRVISTNKKGEIIVTKQEIVDKEVFKGSLEKLQNEIAYLESEKARITDLCTTLPDQFDPKINELRALEAEIKAQ